jgi:hypothetical protein
LECLDETKREELTSNTQTNVIGGHFLKEDIGLFDASFFNLSSETAAVRSYMKMLREGGSLP